MTDVTSLKKQHRHHWRRDLVELAALFTAVSVADTVAKTVVRGPGGPVMLVASAIALLFTAGFHTWWARRHSHAPPHAPKVPEPPAGAPATGATTLWRMRTTVRDEPGSLAALCAALAELSVDILSLQTH
ncbi:GNAT family N-acetyltransferase, partial [Streptomyces sp. T-3]|nr:GNAT family N-acetyltransferase [Streptomyces sp. T-3]